MDGLEHMAHLADRANGRTGSDKRELV
jgi:hypothetical protein